MIEPTGQPPSTSTGVPAEPDPGLRQTGPMPFRFTATAGEYFRIWIVNVFLSVLTLGIYSAWAKVRTRQYFYRHTHLGDASFEYLANPIAILKGRLLVAAVLISVSLSQHFAPALYAVLVLGLFLATPWVIVKALSFTARNSAYKNIRFSFHGTTGESFTAYLVGGLVYLLTCGLGMPYMQWRISQFAVDGHRFGKLNFHFRSTSTDYFTAFLVGFLITIPLVMVWFGVVFGAVGLASSPEDELKTISSMMYVIPVFYALLIVPAAYLKAKIANLFWGGISIGEHSLESNQTFGEVLALQVTNILGVILSVGLLTPWAIVRSMRYRAEHLTLHPSGPLVVEAGTAQDKVGAFGDAATDLGDFDLDFG